MIPKIIHYCWLSNDPIPEDLQKCMESWKKYLPDYEIMWWNFDRFPKEKSKWVKDAFDRKKYAFAADYIRLYAVYNYGGIYLDMDVEVLKSFNPLLELKTMICWQNEWPGLEVAAFGAEKGCSWLKDCLDFYDHREFVNPDGTFNTRPLPGVVEKIIRDNNYVLLDVKTENEALLMQRERMIPVFPAAFFSPKSLKTNKIKTTADSYSIHHFAGSWLPWYNRMEAKFCNILGVENRAILTSLAKKLGFYK